MSKRNKSKSRSNSSSSDESKNKINNKSSSTSSSSSKRETGKKQSKSNGVYKAIEEWSWNKNADLVLLKASLIDRDKLLPVLSDEGLEKLLIQYLNQGKIFQSSKSKHQSSKSKQKDGKEELYHKFLVKVIGQLFEVIGRKSKSKNNVNQAIKKFKDYTDKINYYLALQLALFIYKGGSLLVVPKKYLKVDRNQGVALKMLGQIAFVVGEQLKREEQLKRKQGYVHMLADFLISIIKSSLKFHGDEIAVLTARFIARLPEDQTKNILDDMGTTNHEAAIQLFKCHFQFVERILKSDAAKFNDVINHIGIMYNLIDLAEVEEKLKRYIVESYGKIFKLLINRDKTPLKKGTKSFLAEQVNEAGNDLKVSIFVSIIKSQH